MNIADKLRMLRKKKKLTLLDVRNLLIAKFGRDAALSVPYLSEIERSITTPSLKSLEKLADVFGLSLGELLSGVEQKQESLQEKFKKLPHKSAVAFMSFMTNLSKVEGEVLNENWMNTLLKIEYKGKYPEDVEEWMDIYRFLKRILNK